jgi:hypothetical protein
MDIIARQVQGKIPLRLFERELFQELIPLNLILNKIK